jgi:hypothetical protein
LLPTILGGGEVIADALVAGTPGTVAGVVIEGEVVVDEPVVEVVAIDDVDVDVAAQPVNKHPTIIRTTDVFKGLIGIPSPPILPHINHNLWQLSYLPV